MLTFEDCLAISDAEGSAIIATDINTVEAYRMMAQASLQQTSALTPEEDPFGSTDERNQREHRD
ncbi:hypothetical protein [Azospirillum brasilense]|uniref:hypothetical protein n=1 Tax=Azospirillum brasilense TaxID=192 RepID=UPI0011A3CC5E|nr:hypothetical protein [Azospirillum brasilense]